MRDQLVGSDGASELCIDDLALYAIDTKGTQNACPVGRGMNTRRLTFDLGNPNDPSTTIQDSHVIRVAHRSEWLRWHGQAHERYLVHDDKS